MSREVEAGRGASRHKVVIFDDLQEMQQWAAGAHYIDPKTDIWGWLDQRKARIAEALSHFSLPLPDRFVVCEGNNLRRWRYVDDPRVQPGAQLTHMYLQRFPRETAFWDYGRILLLVRQCEALRREEGSPRLLGLLLELGQAFGGHVWKNRQNERIRKMNKQQAASNRGTEATIAKAEQWKSTVRKLRSSSPDAIGSNASVAAEIVLALWPADQPKPRVDSVRKYIGKELAKAMPSPERA
jgi:hypothetical protein